MTKSIEKRDITETKQLLLELKKEDSKGYVSLKEHIDNIIVGNLTNTSAWLEFLITHFSKWFGQNGTSKILLKLCKR